MARIAVTSTSLAKCHRLRERAAAELAGHELVYCDPASPLADDRLADFLAGADAALVGRERIDRPLLERLPQLKAIALYGVGYDNIDQAACADAGVAVFIERGVNAASVAEHTIGLMLAVRRNIARNARLLHDGIWNKDGGRQLAGCRVGIVGCGHVGSRVARLLHALSCELRVHDIVDKSALARETNAREVSLAEALDTDVVSVHVPLTDATHHMFGTEEFASMPAGSIFVNTSRGPVVDQKALKRAVESGHLGGAGIDVFEAEPLRDPGLYRLENLVATPHTAGNSREAVDAMGQAAIEHLGRFFG